MSGQNYIGSKISLISLSDIRYVGILHNINPVESTVALQNVTSHGTEGRKDNPNEEIRPTDTTFDYVVFRGSDIKDLQVFEAPPSFQSEQFIEPVANAAPYTYSSSAASAYYPTPPMFSSNMNRNTDYGTAVPYGNATNYWQSTSNVAASRSRYNSYASQVRYPMPVPENYQTVPSAPPAVTINDLNIHEQGASPPSKKECNEEEKTVASPKKEVPAVSSISASRQTKLSQEKQEVAPVIEQVNEVLLNSLVKQVSDLDIKQPATIRKQKSPNRPPKQQQQQPQQPQPQQQQQQQQQQKPQTSDPNTRVDKSSSRSNGSNANPRGKRNSARNSNRNNSTPTNGNGNGNTWEPKNISHPPKSTASNAHRNASGNIHRRNSGIVIPKSDFDFESSNAKFDKNSSSNVEDSGRSNEEHIVIPEADHFYDKKKSFFDDISCESKEYQKGNRGGKYKEESKLNLETFGQVNPVGQTGKRSRHRGGRASRGRPSRVSRDNPFSSDPSNHEAKEKSN